MDYAKCTLNGQDYGATQFARLPAAELAQKRRHLICTRCGTRALFVKASRSGQGPHFRARPHPNCDMAAPETKRVEGGGDDREMLHNPGDHVVIDLDYGAASPVNGEPGSGKGSGARGGQFVGGDGRRRSVSRQRLRPILRNLIFNDEFAKSERVFELPDVEALPAHELFVNFDAITDEHVNTLRGFWGDIYDTGSKYNGGLWINAGAKDDGSASVMLERDDLKPFLDRNDVERDQLDGMHILVFGVLRKSKERGKLFVVPKGIEYIALYGG